MMSEAPKRFVVVGETTSARRVCAALGESGHEVIHLAAPSDAKFAKVLRRGVDGVAVLLHSDQMSLRYSLVCAQAAPETPIVAAIFDATMSEQLHKLLPQCHVTSPGELAAPVLAASCLDPDVAAIVPKGRRRGEAFVVDGEEVITRPWKRPQSRRAAFRAWLVSQVLPHDAGSTILFAGLTGILLVLGIDWLWLVYTGTEMAEAFQEAAAVVTTVGPAGHHGDVYAVFAAVAMLLTVVFVGMFTAGMVDQLLGPRLVGLFGSRALPRSGHVVVVGLGQVGLRLCRQLMALGVPVVGVERDADGRYLAIARNLRIPVIVGHGGDRLLLERLRIGHARALAAVSSADLDNIAVAVVAGGVAPETTVVLRAGENVTYGETAALLPLGATLNLTELTSAYVVARLLSQEAVAALPAGADVAVLMADDSVASWSTEHGDECAHVTA